MQLPALMVTGTDSKQAFFKTQNWRVWDNAKAKQIIFIKEENKTVITPVPCLRDIINYVEVIPGHKTLRRNNLDLFFCKCCWWLISRHWSLDLVLLQP